MKEKTRETKSVYFSLLEPYDVELLNHAKQINPITGKERNFSKYVRRLIEEDMRRERQGGNNNTGGFTIIDRQNDEDEEYTLEVKNAMNSFL
jgi:hypothetical protein